MSAVQAGGAGAPEPQRVADALEEVFARPEFQDEESPVADAALEFLDWLGDLLSDILPDVPEGTLDASLNVFWVLLAILAAALAIWLAYSIYGARLARRRGPVDAAAQRLAQRVAELRERAARAQRDGDLTLALRLYFFALVVGLGERGELAYNDAWTNRELLERGEPGTEVARVLRPLVGELDAHSFGHVPTGPAEVARFAALCDRLLGQEVAA